ncbi:Type I restriction-modification system, DNA-methyltransferase subunit M [hydrothermal vent metagenome]|uniref:site-specific DNA-methyltransferase (adenine-specific) n=1 Tax=hydrothermal vent metagenome TaxID=652676 RepID=A0A3B0V4X6_9ZZZZ
MTQAQKKKLQQQLWYIADALRGKMHADEFRDYCLGLIFYKYLSEKLHAYADDILRQDKLEFTQLDENDPNVQEILDAVRENSVAELGYFLPPSYLFGNLARRSQEPPEFILPDLTEALASIERSTMGAESEADFDHLFEDLDLTSTKLGRSERDKNKLIAKVLVHLDKIDFGPDDTGSDILGDAYEYLIGEFASGAGKKAGEFYTPAAVSTVLARIVTSRTKRLKSIYDPACGSGSLLLRVVQEAEEVGDIYGQEMNRTTYNLARMNMILHGVHFRNFDLRQEDTLERPQHEGMSFDAVVANPPFSAKWSANKLFESDDRFSQYGRLAPKSKADFAFVQHMLHQLDDNGTMAVILPHGVLFRGAAEGHIRRYLIGERNWLDGVIGLPSNIFYGTSIPTCILIFKKCREHPDDVLFVDASAHFEKVKNQNKLRPQDIDKIIDTYRQWRVEEKYSHVAPLSEIAENEYNLNIPRYVDTFEEEEAVDLAGVTQNLLEVHKVFELADEKIAKYCHELGIPKPIGSNLFLLREYKRGVMQQIFTQAIRFKGEGKRPFGDWESKKLGELGTFIGGGTPSTSVENYWNGQIPWISSSDITDTSIHKISITRFITAKAIKDSATKLVPAKSILIVSRVGVGKLAISNEEVCTSQDFSNFIPKNDDVYFLAYLLSFYKNKLLSFSQGTSIKGFTIEDIRLLKIEIPSIKEQQKIADFLTAIDRKIDAVAQQINQIERFKKGLLQKMFV